MQILITAFVFVFFFSSCNDNSKSGLTIYKMASSNLERSSALILEQTNCHLESLDKKLWDVRLQSQAAIWQPIAAKVHLFSNELILYLDTLIVEIENRPSLDEGDRNLVEKIFLTKKRGDDLFRKLKKYESDIINLKPQMGEQVLAMTTLPSKGFEISEGKDFSNSYFTDIPSIAAIVMLYNIENKVRETEYELVRLCDNYTTPLHCGYYEEFSPLVSQSSTKVKVGEAIEINAGIGAFSQAAQPKVTINGKRIELNAAALAVYKMDTNIEPGAYRFPVKVEYYLPDGQLKSYSRYLYFTVEK